MKPTSIIFLIISVMLALVGILLCFTATNMANDQGVAIFTQTGDADSNYTSVHEFDGAAVKNTEVAKLIAKKLGYNGLFPKATFNFGFLFDFIAAVIKTIGEKN